MKNKVAENLKEIRVEMKLTQSKLAEMLGTTQKCVSKWENNLAEPSIDYLLLLADIFGISIDMLCGRTDW